MAVPTYDELFNPLIQALRNLGGSASTTEQEIEVSKLLSLTDKDISEIHSGSRTKLSYRLAWARYYMKRFGLLENSIRGIWSLTAEGLKVTNVNIKEVKRRVNAIDRPKKGFSDPSDLLRDGYNGELTLPSGKARPPSWEEQLLETVKKIPSDAFERLCQRLLRETRFIQVEVTGRSGDGGIDGKGVVRIGGILSFHVVFQCKRYRGSVPTSVIRDFRGAFVGRADKGLIITTGAFTRDARAEAQRDGASPIDLIDGEELVQKLKDLEIGVEVQERRVEEVVILKEYFEKL